MQEISTNLLNEAYDILDELIPVLQRNIAALQHDSNPLLKHLIQQELECQEDLLEQLEELQEKLHDHLHPSEEPAKPDEQENDLEQKRLQKEIRHKSYPPGGKLGVTMPNGEKIRLATGVATYVKVIEEIGIEKVKSLKLKHGEFLIIDDVSYIGVNHKRSGDYYIRAPGNIYRQMDILREIAERLNIDLIPDLL